MSEVLSWPLALVISVGIVAGVWCFVQFLRWLDGGL